MPRSRTRASSSPAAYGTAHVDVDPQRGEERGDLGAQRVDAEAGQRRDEHRARDDRRGASSPFARGVLDEVGLVERDEARLVARPELVEDRLDRRPVLVDVGVGGVDDLDQHVGPVDLLERRPERVDELVRQLVDEADRVGDDRRLAVAELDLAADVGSSVAKSLSSARATSVPTSALSSVDLPAFV